MVLLLILQFVTILYFCNCKEGFHYDECYSYYSSNATNALFVPENDWKDCEEIRSEFQVRKGDRLNYGLVNQMQSLDVHPPLYYFLLHTVCGMSKGIFSKWQGLSINLLFFVLSWIFLAKITRILTDSRLAVFSVCLLYGFSPAVYSGITFIRMYMMLTFECFLMLYFHLRALKNRQFSWGKFFIPVLILSFAGFYTHYYFAVFLFFLAVPTFFYLLLQKGSRIRSLYYGGSVVLGLGLVVCVYPACLGHIFRGYRGEEAMDAFFSAGNFAERFNFFYNLTGEYAFGGLLSVTLLVLVLLCITNHMLRKIHGTAPAYPFTKEEGLLLFLIAGYFTVVAKTALLNAEEAIRYEMPIYGPVTVIIVTGLFHQCRNLGAYLKNGHPGEKFVWPEYAALLVAAVILAGEIYGLTQKKVCFLYEEDRAGVEWASDHKDEAVAYIYNPSNLWMVWDEAPELMQYGQIYFCSGEAENIQPDDILLNAEEIYVYAMRGEQAEKQLEMICRENDTEGSCE